MVVYIANEIMALNLREYAAAVEAVAWEHCNHERRREMIVALENWLGSDDRADKDYGRVIFTAIKILRFARMQSLEGKATHSGVRMFIRLAALTLVHGAHSAESNTLFDWKPQIVDIIPF